MVAMERILTTALPDQAARHFAAKLSLETDPSDVYSDMRSGGRGFVVIDARSRDAYREAHVPGAVSLPYVEIDVAGTAGLSRNDVMVVYCWGPHCNAAAKAALRLSALGYRVREMIGGIEGWQHEGLPLECGDDAEVA